MKILSRIREYLDNLWLGTWRQVALGELIAITKPITDSRR